MRPSANARGTPRAEPVYVGGAHRREVHAHFPSGTIVRASRDRVRSYPGLRGAAPPTLAFYVELGRRARGHRVLDVGSGAGEGAAVLARFAREVVGLERDAEALAFSRQVAPTAEFVQHDVARPIKGEPADAAVIADVLGHVSNDLLVLLSVRDALVPGGALLIAEPRASLGQRLLPPARRAYSPEQLESLAARAGFRIAQWLSQNGTFVAALFERDDDSCRAALARASRAELEGDFDAALEAFERARQSSDRDVLREAWMGSGRCLMARGDGDGCVMAFGHAHDVDPGAAMPLARLSQVAWLTGSVEDAVVLAMQASKLDSANPIAAHVAALGAEHLAHPGAFGAWRIAALLAPAELDVVGPLSRLATTRGDAPFAISLFERLRSYGDALGVGFHVTLGYLLLSEGRRADARLEAELAVRLDPKDTDAAELLAATSSQRQLD